mmetsp:Transcript_5938/g.12415  ORF Transcript_5938/g.12415 Transcript_5938/m.12415 type:complete len:231 (-) Transcript_5938:75-767(-)
MQKPSEICGAIILKVLRNIHNIQRVKNLARSYEQLHVGLQVLLIGELARLDGLANRLERLQVTNLKRLQHVLQLPQQVVTPLGHAVLLEDAVGCFHGAQPRSRRGGLAVLHQLRQQIRPLGRKIRIRYQLQCRAQLVLELLLHGQHQGQQVLLDDRPVLRGNTSLAGRDVPFPPHVILEIDGPRELHVRGCLGMLQNLQEVPGEPRRGLGGLQLPGSTLHRLSIGTYSLL